MRRKKPRRLRRKRSPETSARRGRLSAVRRPGWRGSGWRGWLGRRRKSTLQALEKLREFALRLFRRRRSRIRRGRLRGRQNGSIGCRCRFGRALRRSGSRSLRCRGRPAGAADSVARTRVVPSASRQERRQYTQNYELLELSHSRPLPTRGWTSTAGGLLAPIVAQKANRAYWPLGQFPLQSQ
jgi:hypothetical protein